MKKLTLAVLTLLFAAFSAQAAIEAGMKEIQLQGSLTHSSSDDTDDVDYNATGQVVLNLFLSDSFSVGGAFRLNASMTEPDDGEERKSGSAFVLGRADLYLGSGEGNTIPYIGGQAGLSHYIFESDGVDNSSTTLAYGGHAGLKIFPSENTSWNLEGDVTLYEPDVGEAEESTTITDISFLVGFSYYF